MTGEYAHRLVERLGLFQVRQVWCTRNDDQSRSRDSCVQILSDADRGALVGLAVEQEGGHRDRVEDVCECGRAERVGGEDTNAVAMPSRRARCARGGSLRLWATDFEPGDALGHGTRHLGEEGSALVVEADRAVCRLYVQGASGVGDADVDALPGHDRGASAGPPPLDPDRL